MVAGRTRPRGRVQPVEPWRTSRLGDRSSESLALGNLSQNYRALGRLDEALAYQRQSLAIIRELGDRLAEARSLNGMGSVDVAEDRDEECALGKG
jgi:hypothetical protein